MNLNKRHRFLQLRSESYGLCGHMKTAPELHWSPDPLFRDLFVESNPVPIQHAQWRAGFCRPLASLVEDNVATLAKLEVELRL